MKIIGLTFLRIRKRLSRELSWFIEDISWPLVRSLKRNNVQNQNIKPISIGIATFLDRYEKCFKPLLKKIALLFPEYQIIVIANGHVKEAEQRIYIESITNYCARFSNVKLETYINPRGLSFIWNRMAEISGYNKLLILNDDLKIKRAFRDFIINSGIAESEIALINRSWSHFIISRDLYNMVGPFDEGFREIGGEDDDYTARIAMKGKKIKDYPTHTITSRLAMRKRKLRINSYGKNMYEETNGYSDYNSAYLEKKWIVSNDKFDGATEVPDRLVKYWKLRTDKQSGNGKE